MGLLLIYQVVMAGVVMAYKNKFYHLQKNKLDHVKEKNLDNVEQKKYMIKKRVI